MKEKINYFFIFNRKISFYRIIHGIIHLLIKKKLLLNIYYSYFYNKKIFIIKKNIYNIKYDEKYLW